MRRGNEMKILMHSFPDVGINELKDLRKDELITLVTHMVNMDSHAKFWIDGALNEIARARREEQDKKEDELFDKYMKLRGAYTKLLAPYVGKKITKLPKDVLDMGAEFEREMAKAQKRWEDYVNRNK